MTQSRLLKLLAMLFAFALIAASCGDSDDDESSDETSDEATGDTSDDESEPADDESETSDEETDSTDDDATDEDSDGDDGGESGATPAEAPGFDGETIKVGIITDQSGRASIIGQPLTAGGEAYYAKVNAEGGVAGKYMIETVQEDSAYEANQATQKYNDIKDDVAVIGQLFGTPIVEGLSPLLADDNIIASPASLDSPWVRDESLLPIGAPYQVQAVNGLDWWVNAGGGSLDQTFCALANDSAYGDAGVDGANIAAEKLGFELAVEARFPEGQANAEEFGTQISQLQSENCEVVFVTALPSETGPAMGAAASVGMEATFIGSSPTWINALLGSEALVPYLEANYYLVAEGATWGDESVPGMAAMISDLEEFTPDQDPDYYFAFGYNQAQAIVALLEKAVEDGDLSRDGLKKAMENLGTVSFDGLSGDYEYGPADTRQPPTTNTIFKINAEVPNGVEAIAQDYESEFASEVEF